MRAEGSGAFPIAVIGAACRFPGAGDLAEFWSLLRSGTDAIGPMPEQRWDVAGSFHPDPARPGKTYTREGGFIADIDKFDAGFFGISPREARRIDPQQRILLELTWDAMENAGIVPARLAGSQTGVFIGISFSDYAALQREDPEHVDAYVMSGSAVSNAANRISYIFDLHGPSFAVDTACSSSLVAVHEACVSLWRGESIVAIAGGINALLSPSGFIGFSKARMLSPRGRCHAFDASGDGYVRSEGGGVVLLKPLAQAAADGDPIWAVIAGSGVNSDGRTTGLAMPNPVAQEALLRQVYCDAGIDPASVAYIEAHGTGTSVGDPVECTALGHVFGAARPSGDPCRIGSVKTNVGHLEPASGVAGLMKVLLALRHRELPRSLHLSAPNPQIPFAELNLAVVTEKTKLAPGSLVMGVNSFGFGGTNAHIVLRGPDRKPVSAAKKAVVATAKAEIEPLLISAANDEALGILASRYGEVLRSPGAPPLQALCRAAATHRTHHAQRLAVFGANAGEIATRLEAFAAGESAPQTVTGQAPASGARLAFVFSGNGSQWRGMGQSLLADPFAAEWIGRVDTALQPHLGWSVKEVLQSSEREDLYDRTEYAQPALFALQVAVLEWLRARGIEAEAMLGHSVGEIAAAYAAGILPLAEACRVIAVRSQAQQRTAGAGRMAALGLSAADAAAAIEGYEERLTIAGINSPNSVTIAGDADAIAALGAELKDSGTFYRELALDYAFHSRAMDPLRGELFDRLGGLVTLPGQHRFISAVTGGELTGDRLGAAYWWDNIRKPVLFAQAIGGLTEDGVNTFLEIGPHPILDGYLRECLRAGGGSGAALATLRRREPEPEALWTTLGRCYGAGVAIDFDRLYPEKTGFVALPAYPWQRERYWFSDSDADAATPARPKKHPLLGTRQPTAEAIWKNRLDPAILPWLADHVVQGSTVVPGTAFIEMALAAAAMETGAEAIEVEGFEIHRPVVIASGGDAAVEAAFSTENGDFRLLAGETARGVPPVVVARALPLATSPSGPSEPLAAIRKRLDRKIDGKDIYRRFDLHGLHYGPAFQGVAETWAGAGEALGRIEAPESIVAELGDYRLHPAILDACLQVTLAALPEDNGDDAQAALVPSKADRIRFRGGERRVAWCHMRVTRTGARSIIGSFTLFDQDGATIAEIEGMRFRRVELAAAAEIPAYHWRYQLLAASKQMSDADDLPNPQNLAAALDGGRDEDRGRVRVALDGLAASYAQAAFADLADAHGLYTPLRAKTNGAGPPVEARVITKLLALVEQAGLAERDGDSWRLADRKTTPIELWREALARFPANLPALQLIARAGETLTAILRHDSSSNDDSAAGQDSEILEALYDADPLFHGPVEAMAAMLQSASRTLPETRLLRVLEVAGGSGGFTGALLAALPAARTDYVFSDRDEGVVASAEARFAGFTSLSCAVFDLGRSPTEQGFNPAPHDIVIAGAAIATTSQPSRDLAAIAALLKPGGLLMLPAPQTGGFLDLVAATVPGLLEASEIDWPRALRDAGFTDVVSVGGGAGSTSAVIVARKSSAPILASVETIEARTWVVLTGGKIDPAILAGRLETLGQRVVMVEDAGKFKRLGLNRFAMPQGDRDSYARLLQLLTTDGADRLHLVYLRGLAETEPSDPLAPSGSYDLLTLVQGAVATGIASTTKLTVATAGAMASVGRGDGVARPWQAPLWGVGRTVMNERADISCRVIDLDPEAPAEAAMAALCDELLHPDAENEILLRGGGRYAPRLTRGLPQPDSGKAEAKAEAGFALAFGQGDASDRTILNPITIPRPGADEVVVRVHAAGVNFRDVLQRIGLLPEEAFEQGFAGPTMGLEFSGEVIAVGENVNRLRPGDNVFGFGRNAFSSHLVAPAFCLFRKPPSMSFAEAATLPVAAVTVYYSLHHLARLTKGERILIHGAAGGVGLAAVQYAQSVGADIFASAGTSEKRALLRRLGVRHIVDSRTLAFADDIRAITGGEGIDVVLNSLAGEAIHKGISILRSYGRFVELGKRDFYANSKLGLSPFRHNIQFFGVDVDTLLVDRPVLARALFEELGPLLDDGVFSPLPHRVYPIARAGEAFRSMQQSRHIGKIVIATAGADGAAPVPAPTRMRLQLSPDATYLVTGGRGGFGLATAEWLAGRGARHLALIGRSQITAPDAATALDRLRKDGVDAREFSADVTDEVQLAGILSRIRRDMPPLRGIVHAAAVIQDVALVNTTEANFHDVLRPKMAGAWNLHRQTLEEKLDFFVLYSSAITLFGNEGQANYAAANMYLEALAAHRSGLGLPGLAVAWGAISDVGHMARHAALTERVKERLGVRLLAPARALDRMADALATGAASVALAEVSWSRLAALPAIAKAPKYARMRDLMSEEAGEASGANAEEIRAHLAGLPREEAIATVQQLLIKHIAGVVGTAPAKIPTAQPLTDLGMDSLMLVELQIGLDKQFGVAIPTLELMDLATVEKLGRRIVDEIGSAPATASEAEAAVDALNPIADEPEPAFELTLGRILEQELDRAKERPL
jgi:acyl transferase domain-containing protein/NADPH:quinone reductase-like Zn-dependent oxidoreductase/acyl carrier protein